jgi:hypothetical protein
MDNNDDYINHWRISPNLLFDVVNSGFNVDTTGNYYVAGNRDASDTIGGHTGQSGAFVAKFNPQGQLLWLTGEEAPSTMLFGMDVNEDNVCITGWVTRDAILSGDTIQGISSSMQFVACYDLSGNLKWLNRVDSVSAVSNGIDIMILEDQIVNTGNFYGHAKFGNYTLISEGNADPALVWYDFNGEVTNAKNLSGTGGGQDIGWCLAHDPNGNIYVGGTFANELYIAGDTLVHQWSDRDIFIAKYGVAMCRDTATGTYMTPSEKPATEVKVIPNPMNEQAVIKLAKAGIHDVRLVLYDLSGRAVRKRIIPAGETSLTLYRGALTSGLYLWQVDTDRGQVARGKVIME